MSVMYVASAQNVLAKADSCPVYSELRPLLNSERIQSCFGSYGVEVLEQNDDQRISSLYSLQGEQKITRTLAISEFAGELPTALQPVLETIRAGASMGSTLEAAGWRVEKRHRYFGEIPVTPAFRCMSGLPESPGTDSGNVVLAVQVYDLWVRRDEEAVQFALLAELHDPRYLTLADLTQIYDGLVNQLNQPDEVSEQLLQRARGVCTTSD